MVDADVVAAKHAEAERRIGRVRTHRTGSAQALAADADALDLVSFNLMLAVQCCLDVASHVISDEGWPPAPDIAGSFARLHERGVLTAATAAALGRAAGLRNVVAHVDAPADPALVHAATTTGLDDLERFAAEVAAWGRSRVDAAAPD